MFIQSAQNFILRLFDFPIDYKFNYKHTDTSLKQFDKHPFYRLLS